ncbi:MAG: hypothetical protein H0T40_13055 [Geodermatophilaceae bacterium]|nr:hypothetical protein [Geodermatophilaceae bacterium]
MGWLFGKKDDALYRGDAPASAPGLDGVQPSAYQGNAAGRPYDPIPVETPSPYPTAGTPNPYPTAGLPPEFAAVMAAAAAQQRVIKRSVGRSLFAVLLPLLLVGGLVVVGFVAFDNLRHEFVNPFSSDSAPGEPFQGVVGTAGDVTLGENSYQITIESATAQPSAAWGSYSAPVSGGFLVVELSLTRTDTNASVSQISWFDWTFTSESQAAVGGELIAGGYEPLLSTLNLATGESATGLVAFDTLAAVGTLALETYDGAWAQWPITAATPGVLAGELGVPVHPEAARAAFSATVANPRWIAAGDPAAWIDPASGTYLVLDLSVTLDEGALTATSSLSVGYDNWQFTPDGGVAVASFFGVTGADSLGFSAGQPTTAGTLIAFDAPRGPGTLSLVNGDGSVLAVWVIPAL